MKPHAFIIIAHATLVGVANAQYTTVINAPPDPIPASIGSNTQLNADSGATLPFGFAAGVEGGQTENIEVNLFGNSADQGFHANAGSTVNINGGFTGVSYQANSGSTTNLNSGAIGLNSTANAGSEVNILGGLVGDNFTAGNGSVVDVQSGRINLGFTAESGSRVSISGGTFFGLGGVPNGFDFLAQFAAEPGSDLTISGGLFGVGFVAAAGSTVSLVGGDFLLNGQTPSASTVSLAPGDVLSGAFEDGSPFLFVGVDASLGVPGDTLLGVNLVDSVVPPIELEPIVVDGSQAPDGLRQGQTLTLKDGGSLGSNFAAIDASLSIEGGMVGPGLEFARSVVEISGGTVTGPFIQAFAESNVNISGGQIPGVLVAHKGAEISLFGAEYAIDGMALNLSAQDEPLEIELRTGELSGVLSDGSLFTLNLSAFDEDALLTVSVIPEPTSLGLLVTGSLTYWRRRR